MLLKNVKCRARELQPASLVLNPRYSSQAGTNMYPPIHIYSRLHRSNETLLWAPKVGGTQSTSGTYPRKTKIMSPTDYLLSDPTAENNMMSTWKAISQRTTFPSTISDSEMSILWFPTIPLPLVSLFSFCTFLLFPESWCFFWQISHLIRRVTEHDWHLLVDNNNVNPKLYLLLMFVYFTFLLVLPKMSQERTGKPKSLTIPFLFIGPRSETMALYNLLAIL